MAYWDYHTQKVCYQEPKPCSEITGLEEYTDWEELDCGCSNGLEWGGESPRECKHCLGRGIIYRHTPSGRLKALWPGGPFCGSSGKERKSNE